MSLTNGNYCTFDVGGTSLTLNSVISGDGVLYKQSGTSSLILNGTSPAFTGGVLVYAGKLVLNGSIGCGLVSQSGTTIAGTGNAAGLVNVSGALQPGDVNAAGTFTASGLALQSGATLTMDLNSTTTVGGGVNDLIQVNGDLTLNGNPLYINPLSASIASGTYTLLTYTGNANGFFSGASTITPSRYTFTLTNVTTTTPKQVRLIVTGSGGGPASLSWNNASGDGLWNTSASLNWSNMVSHVSPDSFFSQDSVWFTDAASTKTLELDTIVIPNVATINSTGDYTIQGSGKISGIAALVKQGTGKLALNTTNDFIGSSCIQNGTLVMGNASALGATNGTIIITNTGMLDVNGSYLGAKPLLVSGTITNSGGGVYGFASSITLAGNTTISGNRLDLSTGTKVSTLGKPCNLNFSGDYREFTAVNFDTNVADMDMNCNLGLKDLTTLGNPTNTLTVRTELDYWSGNGPAKVIRVMPSAKVQVFTGGTFSNAFVFEDGASFNMYGGDNRTFTGPVNLKGMVNLLLGDHPSTFNNVISGPGGFYWTAWNNQLVLSATNTYTGMTYLGNGQTLGLSGNGSISASSPIVFGGTDPTSTRIDVSARNDQTFTLANGQNLFGIGKINGSLVTQNGSTLQPGTNGVLGALTVGGTAVLNGTTTMKLNGSGTNDLIQAGSSISLGGTLNLVFTAGTLSAGNTYKLFSAASSTGSFASILPATPGSGLAWDTSDLGNGNLKVASAALPPTFGKIIASAAGVVTIQGNGGAPTGSFRVLSSTNVALPKASWIQVSTGAFDGTGGFSFKITNSATEQQKFYLMQVP